MRMDLTLWLGGFRRSFVINSFSKFFGMTGWRLGWVVIPSNAAELFSRLTQNLIISPNAPAQYAALAAFSKEAMMIHAERAEFFAPGEETQFRSERVGF